MARARHHKKFPVVKFAILGGIIALVASVAYFGFATRTSILPAGGKNFSLKISKTTQGIAFVSLNPSGGKKSLAVGHNSPTMDVIRGDTVTIHIISEIHGEKFDFVIPDLNVHSKMVGFFEADTITFVPDRAGEFVYTSTSHPEMKGLLVVSEK